MARGTKRPMRRSSGRSVLPLLAILALASGCGGKRPPTPGEEAYVAAAFPVVIEYCEPQAPRQTAKARLAAQVVDRIGHINHERDLDAPFTLFKGEPTSLRQVTRQLAEM